MKTFLLLATCCGLATCTSLLHGAIDLTYDTLEGDSVTIPLGPPIVPPFLHEVITKGNIKIGGRDMYSENNKFSQVKNICYFLKYHAHVTYDVTTGRACGHSYGCSSPFC